jgi:hypothetical protein
MASTRTIVHGPFEIYIWGALVPFVANYLAQV